MKPIYSFLFILSIFVALICITVMIPENGVPFGNDTLSLPSVSKVLFLQKDSSTYADISHIIEKQDSAIDIDTGYVRHSKNLILKLPDTDSVIKKSIIIEKDEPVVAANTGELKKDFQLIEFPNNDPSILYPIFKKFKNAKTSHELIRILHYGDSQIEGDRITSYIRHELQKKFGGSGVGVVPPVQPYNYQTAIRHYTSENWTRYTSFPHIDKSINHNRYGLLASFARFTPPLPDSLINEDNVKEAWIQFEPSYLAYRSTRDYNQCQLFFGNVQKPLIVEVFVNEVRFDAEMLTPSPDLKSLKWNFSQCPKTLRLQFSGADSPEVYAIALNNSSGIAVDNIPLRGSSGLFFTKADQALFSQLLKELDVKMMFLQFGGNVVPYIKNHSYYEKLFYAQLRTIKKALPGVPIIVIGPADMSENVNGKYVTHHNLIPITEAVKKAAFKANCGYWDMFKAMGGKNSMPSWVNANPTLASKDYIHFNRRGAKVIAELFYKSFIYEYEKYINESR